MKLSGIKRFWQQQPFFGFLLAIFRIKQVSFLIKFYLIRLLRIKTTPSRIASALNGWDSAWIFFLQFRVEHLERTGCFPVMIRVGFNVGTAFVYRILTGEECGFYVFGNHDAYNGLFCISWNLIAEFYEISTTADCTQKGSQISRGVRCQGNGFGIIKRTFYRDISYSFSITENDIGQVSTGWEEVVQSGSALLRMENQLCFFWNSDYRFNRRGRLCNW